VSLRGGDFVRKIQSSKAASSAGPGSYSSPRADRLGRAVGRTGRVLLGQDVADPLGQRQVERHDLAQGGGDVVAEEAINLLIRCRPCWSIRARGLARRRSVLERR